MTTKHTVIESESKAPRLYHLDCVNDTKGTITRITGYPMIHSRCITMRSKLSAYPWRRVVLVEVSA